jgi:predicted nucleic acid-binding protein
MKRVCVDACFLIGLYDRHDQHHEKAKDHFLQLFDGSDNSMVIPWPILYEVVSTRMVRNKAGMLRLEDDWKHLQRRNLLELLSDEPYRERVIEDSFDAVRRPSNHYRNLSAVDRVVRNILADRSVQIHAFVTFNRGDFADVCTRCNREMLC